MHRVLGGWRFLMGEVPLYSSLKSTNGGREREGGEENGEGGEDAANGGKLGGEAYRMRETLTVHGAHGGGHGHENLNRSTPPHTSLAS